MNSLPIELCENISKFVLSAEDANSLKIVSKTFNRTVKSLSIRSLKFASLFNKPIKELARCANEECAGWEPIGHHYQHTFDVKYKTQKTIYYPYCFFCSSNIYEHIKFGGMMFVNVEYPDCTLTS